MHASCALWRRVHQGLGLRRIAGHLGRAETIAEFALEVRKQLCSSSVPMAVSWRFHCVDAICSALRLALPDLECELEVEGYISPLN